MIEHYTIDILSIEWIITNLITLCLISLFLFYGIKILKSHDQRVKFGLFIGVILLSRFLFIHSYQLYIDIWDKAHSLPLHLCGISAIISFIVLLYSISEYFFSGSEEDKSLTAPNSIFCEEIFNDI